MARGKKKEEALTPEEKLAQALVPVEEQPYSVPENWCCFYFTSLIDIEGGTQPPKSQFVDTCKDGYVRLIQIRDFATDKYAVYVPDSKNMRHFNNNDILIARYGASLGRICTGLNGVYNVALAKTIFSEIILYRRYVYWMLQSESFQVPLLEISRTAQAGFNKNDLATFKMPLPPFAEQQRIVDRIESLFAKLDEAKEKAQAVVDGFETRKAAILYKAFHGELTKNWRQQHSFRFSSWEKKKLGEVVTNIKDKFDPIKDKSINVPYIGLEHIEKSKGIVDRGNPDDVKSLKTLFKKGDILYGKLRPYLDKHDIAPISGMCSTDILVYRASSNVTAFFINYIMATKDFINYAVENSKGINLPRISEQAVSNYLLMMPSYDEQAEIVSILNTLFTKERQAKETAEAVIDQIDTIKKSILARAFRGELGTNDLAEESALELLKDILLGGKRD